MRFQGSPHGVVNIGPVYFSRFRIVFSLITNLAPITEQPIRLDTPISSSTFYSPKFCVSGWWFTPCKLAYEFFKGEALS